MSFEDFIQDLLSTPIGRIVAVNLLQGSRLGLHSRKYAAQLFFDSFEAFLSHPDEFPNYQKMKSLGTVRRFDGYFQIVRQVAARNHSPNARWFWCNVGMPLSYAEGRISTVARVWHLGRLLAFHAHPDDQDRFNRLSLSYSTDSGREDWAEDFSNLDRRECYFRVGHGTLAPHFRGMLWITPHSYVSQVARRTSLHKASSKLRDELGLVHHGNGVWLAAIHYPASLLTSVASGRPTCVEANDHRRFKARGNTERGRSFDPWGRTLDLEHFASEGRLEAGRHERVISQFQDASLTSSEVITFDVLGRLDSGRGETTADNDEMFSRKISSRFKDSTLRAAFATRT